MDELTDISFITENGRFNCRVAAVIVHNEKLLTVIDDGGDHHYLPGGRVKLHETAQSAVERELREEIGIEGRVIRPLWLDQSFYSYPDLRTHELCFYFLVDISETDLLSRGETFHRQEGEEGFTFEWLSFERLRAAVFYPTFLKTEIYSLPSEFKLIAEFDDTYYI